MVIDDAEDAHGGENTELDSSEHEIAARVNFSLSIIAGLGGVIIIHTFGTGERSTTRSNFDRCSAFT